MSVNQLLIAVAVFAVGLVAAIMGLLALTRWLRGLSRVNKLSPTKSQPALAAALNLKFAEIKAGSFLMGSPLHEPGRDGGEIETLHEVTLTKPFKMGVVPITRFQFALFIDSTGYKTRAERGGPSIHWSASGHKKTPGVTWVDADGLTESHPVTRVSWEDARAFCKWAGEVRGTTIRLPTEAEWEYACRAGTETPFAGTGNLDDMGWYAGNSGNRRLDCGRLTAHNTISLIASIVKNACVLHPVGLKKPNAWGLQDMHGNTWEWCLDAHAPYPNQSVTDPTGPKIRNPRWRVMRGGQWADIPSTCRSANRGYFRPGDSIDTFGFRVVEEIR